MNKEEQICGGDKRDDAQSADNMRGVSVVGVDPSLSPL